MSIQKDGKPWHIVHIHTHKLFLRMVDHYRCPDFHNEVLYIGKQTEGLRDQVDYFYSDTRKDAFRIIDHCKTADLVVVYNLDGVKSFIVNRLPAGIKVIWRFFGTELYQQIPGRVLSPLTREALGRANRVNSFSHYWQGVCRLLKWRTLVRSERKKAINRVDFIIMIAEKEYEYLKGIWPELPPFIQSPVWNYKQHSSSFRFEKEPLVILGHSRSTNNNHLDVLQKIEDADNPSVRHILFFSYGDENAYTGHVRQAVRAQSNISLVEEFLPKDEFENMYKKASAFVMNAYRQLGGANLRTALRNGVKVYLNEKNVLYHQFKEYGLHVFSTDALTEDIRENAIALTPAEMAHNLKKIEELSGKYSRQKFQHDIVHKVLEDS